MPRGDGTGPGAGMGRGRRQTGGRGLGGGPLAAGPGGNCVCTACGYKEPHTVGQPCNAKQCPKCGTQMTRE
ncbi:MAG: hypothetical protein WC374_09535 [Phycisphaerae bacterium]|jgi:hypothetical protein